MGSGPVGVHLAQTLQRRDFYGHVKLFGAEPWQPYQRIQLSSLLAGQVRAEDVHIPELGHDSERFQFLHRKVISIDPPKGQIVDDQGGCHDYDRLVLATGSTPWVPGLAGLNLPGVYVFRNLEDTRRLLARSQEARHAVVIGGGLLGVEAARAIQRPHTRVTLIQQADRLLNRQLDVEAGGILKRTLEGYGIEVVLNAGVRRVVGQKQVKAVSLQDGRRIDCDTVILATGIKPNVELALTSGIAIGRGIRVNDQLCTSVDGIYAIGECAQHRDQVYGLQGPGLEQAQVLAGRFCGDSMRYRGSVSGTQLRVLNLPVLTMGCVGDEYQHRVDRSEIFHCASGNYRRIYLHRNRLQGVVSVGECEDQAQMRRAVEQRQRLYPWQIHRFRRKGRLWSAQKPATPFLKPLTQGLVACAMLVGLVGLFA